MGNILSRLRLPAFLAIVLVVAGASLACGQDAADPLPASTSAAAAPPAVAPTVAVAPSPPGETAVTATAVPPTAPPEPTATPTEAPTPAPTVPVASDRAGSGSSGSLVVLSSRSVAAPLGSGQGSGWGSVGGFSLSPVPQTMAAAGSLTVSAIGSVTVAADEAHVVVIPEMDYGPSGLQQLSAKDRQEIIANLETIGFSEEAVEFETLGRYEPSSISVAVDVNEFAAIGEAVVEQIEEVVRRSDSFGVRFTLSEANCEQAISLARREAAPGAEKAADDLADALGVERGAVNGALEYPLNSVPFRFPGTDPSSCGGPAVYPFSVLLPFDSDPEVEVSVGLQVSYDLR